MMGFLRNPAGLYRFPVVGFDKLRFLDGLSPTRAKLSVTIQSSLVSLIVGNAGGGGDSLAVSELRMCGQLTTWPRAPGI